MRSENLARSLLIAFNDKTDDKLLWETISSQLGRRACGKLEPVDICVKKKPVKLKLRGRKKGVTGMTGVGQYCTGASGLVRW